uniref:Uncharacterized protein n=1 Tax=Romanomermis culicivorax TaxID=13658 RepID=A0A915K4P3_ROMCU
MVGEICVELLILQAVKNRGPSRGIESFEEMVLENSLTLEEIIVSIPVEGSKESKKRNETIILFLLV